MRYSTILFVLLAYVATGQKIDQALYPQGGDKLHALVELADDVSYSVSNDMSKEQKGQTVFDALYDARISAQSGLIDQLVDMDVMFQSFYVVNIVKVEATYAQLQEIAERADVVRIIGDEPMPMQKVSEVRGAVSTRAAEPEWGIKMIQADSVWALGYRGQGVVVGGQDTGYDWTVSPLKKKYRGFVSDSIAEHNYNWHDAISEVNPLNTDSINPCGFDINIPCDDNNHGTHTMGTIVGEDDDNSIGVAPGASWVGCRNMDRGWGRPSTYINCFEWFLAPTDSLDMNPRPDLAPHVFANSWGCPELEGCDMSNFHIMEEAVENLRNAGIVVVVSAGNSGSNCGSINTPAAIFDASFVIGATADNDSITGFSSRGLVEVDSSFRMKPDVSAPGRNIRSVIRGGEFRNFSGTSMAGPHVVGLVALVISANPTLAGNVDKIEEIIKASAVSKTDDQECGGVAGDQIPNPVYGYGRVDALKAVELALAVSDTKSTDKKDLVIVPNPAEDYIVISGDFGNAANLMISDQLGRVVYNRGYNDQEEINVAKLIQGVYTVTIHDGAVRQSSKFVKM